ncbi:MerR family transcriptional regulator [Polyangium mundeleinium]|uniref:MerR family transcriptional regulator n=1 Tax=Polyangium mundeleinium TaxID=2995306 RepID=A0ABT5FA02_9BACT|nr:MerR family transcriptional regulator [Polyangium mundeleinium]MDC0749951.1 MerR family transcriptional regulator [Polyangium mundeleinium]
MDITYTAGDAVRVSGLRYKKLDEILRSGLLKPSAGGGQGRGSPRRFTARDLLALRLAREILKAGIRVRTMVGALRYVQRGHGFPELHELVNVAIWTDGQEVALFDKTKKKSAASSSERCVSHVVDLGPAAEHVRRGIERIANTEAQRRKNNNGR